MTNKANEPAFPSVTWDGREFLPGHFSGLTKREYFAVLAMQGLLADPANDGSPESLALYAVKYADALLAELEKGGTK